MLKSKAILVTGLLALTLCAPTLYSAAREMMAPPAAAVIATVNLQKVFDGLEERTALAKSLEEDFNKKKGDLDAEKKRLEMDNTKLKTMTDGPERDAAVVKMARDAAMWEANNQIYTAQIERLRAELFTTVYNNISAAAKKLAEQRGYTMVLSSDDAQTIPRGLKPDNVQQFISARRFLYVAPAHDITDELIAMMNNQFKAGPAGGSGR